MAQEIPEQTPGIVRLSDSKLCADCDLIYNEDFYKSCPACSSASAIRLIDCLQPLHSLRRSKVEKTEGE